LSILAAESVTTRTRATLRTPVNVAGALPPLATLSVHVHGCPSVVAPPTSSDSVADRSGADTTTASVLHAVCAPAVSTITPFGSTAQARFGFENLPVAVEVAGRSTSNEPVPAASATLPPLAVQVRTSDVTRHAIVRAPPRSGFLPGVRRRNLTAT